MRELSVKTDSKIVLLVVDGLGGLPMDPLGGQGQTELEAANTPTPDALAEQQERGYDLLGSHKVQVHRLYPHPRPSRMLARRGDYTDPLC